MSTLGLGALTLSSNATLNYAAGTGDSVATLVFSSFTPNANVLNIINYTNTHANVLNSGIDGQDDRLIFDQNEATNLADFNFGTGTTAVEIALGATGFYEVFAVVVPEPGTWAAGALACAVIGYQFLVVRRRRVARPIK